MGPDSLIQTLEPIVSAHPEDLYLAIALGRALIKTAGRTKASRSCVVWSNDAPIIRLRGTDCCSASTRPVGLTSWRQHRATPYRAGRRRAVRSASGRGRTGATRLSVGSRWLPERLAGRPVGFSGPLSAQPRAEGRRPATRCRHVRPQGAPAQEAKDRILPLYEEANADKTLGVARHPDLYHRLADLRERMGQLDEALAWHRLVLRDQPDDAVSRDASGRLEASIDAGMESRP